MTLTGRIEPTLKRFKIEATMVKSFDIYAETRAEAERIFREALSYSFLSGDNRIDDGQPLTLEGELTIIEGE
jgi:hypothetical protein